MIRLWRTLRDAVAAISILLLALLIVAKLDGSRERGFSGAFSAIDGDTLMTEEGRARLEGLDAPEISQMCRRSGEDWPCGAAARQRLSSMASIPDFGCRGSATDRYGRWLVRCRAAGADVNATLVREGFAVSYGAYAAEEAAARRERVGIWVGSFERPQDWRRVHQADVAGDEFTVPGRGFFAFIRRFFGVN
ncbi:MAG: thermonuclease family protein [Allorhizobium sp.]